MGNQRQVIVIECKNPKSITWIAVDGVASSKEELYQIVGNFVLKSLEEFQGHMDITGIQPELIIKPILVSQTKLDSWDIKALLTSDPRVIQD